MARDKKTNNAYWGSGKIAEWLKEGLIQMADEERRSIADMIAICIEQGYYVRKFKLQPRPDSTRTLNEPSQSLR